MNVPETVQFSIKGPVLAQSGDGGTTRLGCSIIDLNFNQPSQLGELIFTNFYSAFLSIYVKKNYLKTGIYDNDIFKSTSKQTLDSRKDTSTKKPGSSSNTQKGVQSGQMWSQRHRQRSLDNCNKEDSSDKLFWECSIYWKTLMPCPHFEAGSQNIFSIQTTESLVEWRDVEIMRLILYQPSLVWKHFTVEDINVYKNLSRRSFSAISQDYAHVDWHDILKANTKKALIGALIEPEKESQEDSSRRD